MTATLAEFVGNGAAANVAVIASFAASNRYKRLRSDANSARTFRSIIIIIYQLILIVRSKEMQENKRGEKKQLKLNGLVKIVE